MAERVSTQKDTQKLTVNSLRVLVEAASSARALSAEEECRKASGFVCVCVTQHSRCFSNNVHCLRELSVHVHARTPKVLLDHHRSWEKIGDSAPLSSNMGVRHMFTFWSVGPRRVCVVYMLIYVFLALFH